MLKAYDVALSEPSGGPARHGLTLHVTQQAPPPLAMFYAAGPFGPSPAADCLRLARFLRLRLLLLIADLGDCRIAGGGGAGAVL